MKASGVSGSPAVSRGGALHDFVRELYPICRSITGDGLRETLDLIQRFVPLTRVSLPSGQPVFDWEVPEEWNIRDAWIKDADGRRVVDFQANNLHVVSYSTPVSARMTLEELRPHLHTLPQHPDWIPYRTSYYRKTWGFCLAHRQLEAMPEGEYEVVIDATLAPGSLEYGEAVLPGEVEDEILIWTHVCHPSLCNDNLSAIAVAAHLALELRQRPRHHTLRFVFAPATIGAIAWLSVNERRAARIRHGLVLASLGDRGGFTYKRSRQGDADIDRAACYISAGLHGGAIEDFTPYGYDERQFCSPGFNLPVGRLSRTPNGRYAEYHTSADNLEFVTPESLAGSLRACEEIIYVIENNRSYVNLLPKCEPRLGRRGLYGDTGGLGPGEFENALLWVLNYSDGGHDLLAIAQRSGVPFRAIVSAADALRKADLLQPAGDASSRGVA